MLVKKVNYTITPIDLRDSFYEKFTLVKNKLETEIKYEVLKSLVFKSLGICIMSFQMLELTMNGLISVSNYLDENGKEIENEIIENFEVLLQNNFNENTIVDKEQGNLKRYLIYLKKKGMINSKQYDDLEIIRELRNEIVHSGIVIKPFLFYKKEEMKTYILEHSFYALKVAQWIEDVSNEVFNTYEDDYPNTIRLMRKAIEKYNTLKENIFKRNDLR